MTDHTKALLAALKRIAELDHGHKSSAIAANAIAKAQASLAEPVTPEQRIDANLERILKISGSSLRNYSLGVTKDKLREAMRSIMSESYIAGSNAAWKILDTPETEASGGGT
jgi:hypothetical protein